MNTPRFEDFKRVWLDAGFDEVIERQWQPNTVLETHTHPFSVQALVTQGEMWLTCGDSTQHLTPGSTFALDHDVPHSERYGSAGATYWVARKST